jgi:hypothetical protein
MDPDSPRLSHEPVEPSAVLVAQTTPRRTAESPLVLDQHIGERPPGGVECRVVGLLIILLRDDEVAVDSGGKVPDAPEVLRVLGFRCRGRLDLS